MCKPVSHSFFTQPGWYKVRKSKFSLCFFFDYELFIIIIDSYCPLSFKMVNDLDDLFKYITETALINNTTVVAVFDSLMRALPVNTRAKVTKYLNNICKEVAATPSCSAPWVQQPRPVPRRLSPKNLVRLVKEDSRQDASLQLVSDYQSPEEFYQAYHEKVAQDFELTSRQHSREYFYEGVSEISTSESDSE